MNDRTRPVASDAKEPHPFLLAGPAFTARSRRGNDVAMKSWLLGLVAVGAGGCGTQGYTMSMSTTSPTTGQAEPCDFRVVNIPPQGPFEEIATLTPLDSPASTPEAFKKVVHDDVCRIGGTVVVTEINGFGRYMRGTVLRAVPGQASTQE